MADLIPKLLPLTAVAEVLAISPHTVRMWVRKGRLTPVRLCRRLLFRSEDICQLVAASAKHEVEVGDDR
jgi:excisionase family DNA binding protein